MLNLLIIDNESDKIKKIVEVINDLGVSSHIDTAADVKTAQTRLLNVQYDIWGNSIKFVVYDK